MAKFLRILRSIALAVALMGLICAAIFAMNDIGTSAPIPICGAVAAVAAGLALLLHLAAKRFQK